MLAELTVCFEANFEDASQRKIGKFQDLLEMCKANGYTTHLFTLKVGSSGFVNLRERERKRERERERDRERERGLTLFSSSSKSSFTIYLLWVYSVF